MYKSGRAAPEVREYRRYFDRVWAPRRTVGLVAAYDGRIIGADVFANQAVFEKLRHRIIESYALEVFDKSFEPRRSGPSPPDAMRYLQRLHRAEFWHQGSPGVGYEMRFSGNGTRGSGLVFQDNTIHVAVFGEVYDPPIRPMLER